MRCSRFRLFRLLVQALAKAWSLGVSKSSQFSRSSGFSHGSSRLLRKPEFSFQTTISTPAPAVFHRRQPLPGGLRRPAATSPTSCHQLRARDLIPTFGPALSRCSRRLRTGISEICSIGIRQHRLFRLDQRTRALIRPTRCLNRGSTSLAWDCPLPIHGGPILVSTRTVIPRTFTQTRRQTSCFPERIILR